MNETEHHIAVVCELPDKLPLLEDELTLLQGLLPELLKDMQGIESQKE